MLFAVRLTEKKNDEKKREEKGFNILACYYGEWICVITMCVTKIAITSATTISFIQSNILSLTRLRIFIDVH